MGIIVQTSTTLFWIVNSRVAKIAQLSWKYPAKLLQSGTLKMTIILSMALKHENVEPGAKWIIILLIYIAHYTDGLNELKYKKQMSTKCKNSLFTLFRVKYAWFSWITLS